MGRRILAIVLLLLAVGVVVLSVLLAFTPVGASLFAMQQGAPTTTPSPTRVFLSPTPIPSPTPILTAQGAPPKVSALADLLLDADTGHVLAENNGEMPLPMASTTKIMTALIAIQTGNLDEAVTVQQDAINNVINNGGSSAQLVVGDKITLKDLLYGLMLPSGDDAAISIADTVGGSTQNFVAIMNLYAYRLHLYQTHYADPDGLPVSTHNHYTTPYDLVRLARYAMSVPLFAQIVQTQHYTLPATSQHRGYVWDNTNTLLGTYSGMTGIKTGYTGEAGYCLVFSATKMGHHLIGVVLNDVSAEQRFKDASTLLDWGFNLPLLPPAYPAQG